MRTPPLLASILLHSAAVLAVLLVGVYAHREVARPVARIEIRNQPPSALARTEVQACPDVEAEDERDAQPLVDLNVTLPEPQAPEPVIEAAPEPARPMTTVDQVAAERLRKREEPTEEVAPVDPVADEPEVEPAREQESAPTHTAATRSDRGGPPAYPESLRRRNREGTVVLRITVAVDGSVADVGLSAPSRYPAFNRAALRAARHWRFDPATEGGVAVASTFDYTVVFELSGGAPNER